MEWQSLGREKKALSFSQPISLSLELLRGLQSLGIQIGRKFFKSFIFRFTSQKKKGSTADLGNLPHFGSRGIIFLLLVEKKKEATTLAKLERFASPFFPPHISPLPSPSLPVAWPCQRLLPWFVLVLLHRGKKELCGIRRRAPTALVACKPAGLVGEKDAQEEPGKQRGSHVTPME